MSHMKRSFLNLNLDPKSSNFLGGSSFWARFKQPRTVLLWGGVFLMACVAAFALTHLYLGATQSNSIDGSNGIVVVPTANDLKHSYGIAAGGSLTELSDADLDARLAGVAASGAKWIRFDFKWPVIQPNNANQYNWKEYDKLVLAAQKHKLFVLGILDFTPQWARAAECRDTDKCRPADNRQFANFAKTVSNRYKNKGLHYWEIWNEPNSPQFWQPAASPAQYTELLKATAAALRKEDSKAHIITGGLSPQANSSTSFAPIDFLSGVYAAGGKGSFDAVAHHPYTFPISPKSTPFQAWNQMADLQAGMRHLMVSKGDSGKKIWLTEYGAPTGGPGPVSTLTNPQLELKPYVVDEELQARLLSDAIDLYKSYDWVGPFMYYSYKDAGTTRETNENFFGLLRADNSQKPAYRVFSDAARGRSVNPR